MSYLDFFLVGLCMTLASMLIVQMLYVVYVEKMHTSRKERLKELERHCNYLIDRVGQLETRNILLGKQIVETTPDAVVLHDSGEVWVDIIEDR